MQTPTKPAHYLARPGSAALVSYGNGRYKTERIEGRQWGFSHKSSDVTGYWAFYEIGGAIAECRMLVRAEQVEQLLEPLPSVEGIDLVELLAEAVNEIANLDGPGNPVAARLMAYQRLMEGAAA